MDAVKYLKTIDRICNGNCDKCVLNDLCDGDCTLCADIEKVVEEVEKWAEKHPAKTRLDLFKEQYPNGNNCACVKVFDSNAGRDCAELSCDECKDRFWNEEAEE